MSLKKIVIKKRTSDLFDLRVNQKDIIKDTTLNHEIIEVLEKLIDKIKKIKATTVVREEKSHHGRRIASIQKAVDAIRSYPVIITSGIEAMQALPGVGKGVCQRIDEILATGTLAELKDHVDKRSEIIEDLMSITGIGEARAQMLIDCYDVGGANDLIFKYKRGHIPVGKNALTHHVVVGMTYYEDLKQRMMWDEANAIVQRITNRLEEMDRGFVYNFCGSYRRQKSTCGDLDLLISQRNPLSTDELSFVVDDLTRAGILVGHLTENGKTKYMGVCKLSPESKGRRIDIRYVPYHSLGAGLLYFTGSGKLNKIMRNHANRKGYTLNEYGIFEYRDGKKGREIPASSEQEIFKLLNLVYLEPNEREF